jgi:hypothetical protein
LRHQLPLLVADRGLPDLGRPAARDRVRGRVNVVLFSSPTTRCPRGMATTAAPIEAIVSITPQ